MSNTTSLMKSHTRAVSCILSAAVLSLLFTACDTVDPDDDGPPAASGIYIGNQGNFGDGNGSVSFYDPVAGSVTEHAVGDLGSIVQSIEIVNGRGFIMSNTADRIDIFDTESHARTATIDNVSSPRYMLMTQDNKAYVTSLYTTEFTGGMVTVVDPAAGSLVTAIEVGNNPEGLALSGNRLYVSNTGFGEGTTVSVIDISSDEVLETIDVGCDGPRFMFTDEQDQVYIFCTGKNIRDEDWNIVDQTDGEVVVLGGASGEELDRIPVEGRLGAAEFGQDVFYSPETAEAFVVQGSTILVFDTVTSTFISSIDISGSEPIGAVAYDFVEDIIYLGRIESFVEAGHVTMHNRGGSQIGSFDAGIAPTHIAFKRTE